jgi:putative toxin-antitoxin system antitoxin component (TIGR02293 family)
MARQLRLRDEDGKLISKPKPEKAPAKKAAAKRVRATGARKTGNATLVGKTKVSAKLLKGQATQLASEASPVRYLGMKQSKVPARLSQLVANGLPTRTADYLAGNLDVPVAEFTAKYVHIPKQTMARRKHAGKFNVDESDRVARFARLLKHTTDLMEGDQAAAIHWLKSPQILLENQTPLEYARTETGVAEVQQLIGRLEAGVYS